jgi:hypothetical protein
MNESVRIHAENHPLSRGLSHFASLRTQENSKSRLLRRREKIDDPKNTREKRAFFIPGHSLPRAENREKFHPRPSLAAHTPKACDFQKLLTNAFA